MAAMTWVWADRPSPTNGSVTVAAAAAARLLDQATASGAPRNQRYQPRTDWAARSLR